MKDCSTDGHGFLFTTKALSYTSTLDVPCSTFDITKLFASLMPFGFCLVSPVFCILALPPLFYLANPPGTA